MDIITVKCFNSWDETKDIIRDKISSVISDKVTSKGAIRPYLDLQGLLQPAKRAYTG